MKEVKRILITGANSYIGTSFNHWLKQYPKQYATELMSLRDGSWKEKDFSTYDVVCHTAGIAHIKEAKKNENLFYSVNRDLAFKVAEKAKACNVKQFIFLSTMNVYGVSNGVIHKNTHPNPKSIYGKSKLQAEELINSLQESNFQIAIIRPPMVYGKMCKGNYPRLVKLVLQMPFFPDISNKRSMLYIDNLCEFVRLLIDDSAGGVFFPQNSEYVQTSQMAALIAEAHGKKINLTKLFNPLLGGLKSSTIEKVFGDLVYEKEMSQYDQNYWVSDLKTSLFQTEKV